jgi:hypothetical protein
LVKKAQIVQSISIYMRLKIFLFSRVGAKLLSEKLISEHALDGFRPLDRECGQVNHKVWITFDTRECFEREEKNEQENYEDVEKNKK